MKRPVILRQETLQLMLPDIPPAFCEQMRALTGSLAQQGKEPVMQRKISIGLVAALVALLITMGALAAALLSGKDFVEQELAPRAAQNESDKWTQAELDVILSSAQEHGIEMPASLLEELRNAEDGLYKEELMRDFLRTSLGYYPSTWSIEDQAWYHNLLLSVGLDSPMGNCVLPAEGEISQDEAVAIVHAHLAQTYGADPAQLADPAQYRQNMTYRETRHSVYYTERHWYVWLEALDGDLQSFELTLSPQGEILTCESFAPAADSLPAYDVYSEQYGDFSQWTQDVWQAMVEALRAQNEGRTVANINSLCFMQSRYPDEADWPVSRETAWQTALSAMADAFPQAEDVSLASAVLLDALPNALWKVWLHAQDDASGHLAEVDAATGELLSLQPRVHGYLCVPYVSDDTLNRCFTQSGLLLPESEEQPSPTEVTERFLREHGERAQWSEETWVAYGAALNAAAAVHGPQTEELYAYALQRYGLPDEEALPREEAVAAALAGADGQAADGQEALAVYLLDGDTALWQVTFPGPDGGGTMVVLNAHSGEVLRTAPWGAQDAACLPYVLSSSLEQARARPLATVPPPQPTRRPDGRRWIWYSELMPQETWDKLDAVQYRGDNIDVLQAQWTEAFGSDGLFWPLEAKAVLYYQHDSIEPDVTVLPGVPLDTDVQEEEAKAIAAQALRETWDGMDEDNRRELADSLGLSGQDAVLETLQPSVSFWYNTPQMGMRVYRIDFLCVAPTAYGVPVLSVWVDAASGDTLPAPETAPNG